MITYSSVQTVPWIWDGDPALDKEHPKYNREEYDRTGDLANLPIKAGSTARVFQLRRLNRKQFFRATQLGGVDQFVEAVAYGLVSMQPGDCDLSRKASDCGERLTDATLDRLYDLSPRVMVAMGAFVIGLSKPDPT